MSYANQIKARTQKPYSIASRVALWFAVSFMIAGLLMASVVSTGLKRFMLDEAVIDMNNRIEATSFALQKPGALEQFRPELENDWQSHKGELVYVRVLDPDGKELVSSSTIKKDGLTALFPASNPKINTKPHVKTFKGKDYLVYTTHLDTDEPELKQATFQFVTDLSPHKQLLARYYKLFWIVFLVLALITISWSWILIKSSFGPLRHVINSIRRWQSALHDRLPSENLPQELTVLIQTFNEMLDRIEDAFDRLSRFSADIAHELKAPITNITSSTEIKLSRPRSTEEYREALSSNLEEMRRIAEIVESLLFVAKAESPDLNLKIEYLNLRETVEKLVEFYEGLAEESGIVLKIQIDPSVHLFAERTLFERALSNLLSNAIKYSPENSTVTVSAARTDKDIVVTIADEGDGIPADDLPFVFDRFYRGKLEQIRGKTSGHGLGLTIVKSIMNLHKGRAVIATTSNKGTQVSLEFPLEVQRNFSGSASVAQDRSRFQTQA